MKSKQRPFGYDYDDDVSDQHYSDLCYLFNIFISLTPGMIFFAIILSKYEE